MGESYGFAAPGLVTGTMVYIGLALIANVIALLIAKETSNTTKGEARLLGLAVVNISAVCMWMFWAFAYMHQMVPLIYPIHTPVKAS